MWRGKQTSSLILVTAWSLSVGRAAIQNRLFSSRLTQVKLKHSEDRLSTPVREALASQPTANRNIFA